MASFIPSLRLHRPGRLSKRLAPFMTVRETLAPQLSWFNLLGLNKAWAPRQEWRPSDECGNRSLMRASASLRILLLIAVHRWVVVRNQASIPT